MTSGAKLTRTRAIATLLWLLAAVAVTELVSELLQLAPRQYVFVLVLAVGAVVLVRLNVKTNQIVEKPKQLAEGETFKRLPETVSPTVRQKEASSQEKNATSEPDDPREWLNDFLKKHQSVH